MKKLTLAAGFMVAVSLVGCQETSTSTSTNSESSVSGIAAFRSGTATALAEDSSEVGSAPIVDSAFEIPLREGRRPAFLVRVDSAGHRLFARLPKDRVRKIRVDSLAHEIADSLRKAPRPVFDEATLDSLREAFKARKDSCEKERDSLDDHESSEDSLVKPIWPKDSLIKPVLPKDSLVKPVFPKDSLVKPIKPVLPKDSLVKPIVVKDSLKKILPIVKDSAA